MSVVGIDLGTTNTVVACVRDGRVHVLADDKGNRLLPSVVSFHPNGDVLVGPAAKERRLVDAANTIASIKRLIGRPWDSDEIRLARSRFAFELREGPGQGALVIARGEAYTLPEISAFVLKRCRQIAEAALGETVDKAVITVPAHFNELQRASTKVAGRVAGLEVLRILNEPTAAALAYGFGSEKSERVAVYDFGGGTFDCSLLDLTGSLFEVLATAGDTFLGGDDVDTAIAEVMCNAFLAQHRYDPRVDPQSFERLRAAAERLKIDLSTNPQAQVDLPEVAYGVGGRKLGFTFGLTQADLDSLAGPYIDRTLQVTQDALNIARLTPSSFDQIVLVGGSTRMPIVKRRVEAYFGIPVMDRVNPDEVVAVGAAVQAAALVDASRKRSIPSAPTPGVIGPPPPMPEDDKPTAMLTAPLRQGPVSRPPGVGNAPPPIPANPIVKTLRPAVTSVATPFGQFTPKPVQSAADDRSLATSTLGVTTGGEDDHSIGTGQTLPAARGKGNPSLTEIVQPRNAPNPRDSLGDIIGEATSVISGIEEPGTIAPISITKASARDMPRPPAPPAKPNAIPPKPVFSFGAMRPLETEDISMIMPDVRGGTRSVSSPVGPSPSAPPPASKSLSPFGVGVGPLETEDISMIAPEAGNSMSRSAPFPTAISPFANLPSPVGPDPTKPGAAPRQPAPFNPPVQFQPPPQPPPQQGGFRQAPPPPPPPAAFSPFAGFEPPPPPVAAPGDFQFPPPQGFPPPQQGFPPPQFRSAPPPQPPPGYGPPQGWQGAAPVLVDVTPRALVVETVGGYCDTVIPRNAKIPCEHTRVFATGRDLQTNVHVRVAQGEEQKFDANQYLGELELSNLRPAPRGEVTLSVVFELDADGTLLVRAIDTITGQQAQAAMKLIAVAQSDEAIEEMIERSRSVSVTG